MASESKERIVLKLILEASPLKHWHFEEILKKAGVSRAVANKWIKKFRKDGLLKRVKEKGKHPHFTCGEGNLTYDAKKMIFGLEMLYQCGLVEALLALEHAKTVILFGSFGRGDWHVKSDVDIFILGSAEGFDKMAYQRRLKREIELQVFENNDELRKVKSGLLFNVANGYRLKGDVRDVLL